MVEKETIKNMQRIGIDELLLGVFQTEGFNEEYKDMIVLAGVISGFDESPKYMDEAVEIYKKQNKPLQAARLALKEGKIVYANNFFSMAYGI